MVHYKLTYFNGRGLAEASRLLFAAAGVEYEDERITRESWAAMKPTTPFGHLPLLTIDGKIVLSESGAIARYLAREFGLMGKSSVDTAVIDMLVDSMRDLWTSVSGYMRESDEAKKEEIKKKFFGETLPPYLDNLEKVFKQNNGDTGYFVGGSLSYADIVIYHGLFSLTKWNAALLEKHPLLKAHNDRIGAAPKIKAWVEKRPQTEF